MEKAETNLKGITIVLSGEYISKKYLEELEFLLDDMFVNIGLILIDKGAAWDNQQADTKTSSSTLFLPVEFIRNLWQNGPQTITHAEPIFAERVFDIQTARQARLKSLPKIPLDNTDLLEGVDRIYFDPIKTGEYTYKFPDDVVDEVVSRSDIVILLGFTKILRGRILTEPEFGTLSFHPSDIREYRGRPGCYWQFLNNEPTVGLTLQQLTPELDGGSIVVCRHVDISDTKTWWEVKLRVRCLYGNILSEAVKNLQNEEFEPKNILEEELGDLTFSSSRKKWRNELRMTAKNFYGRYFR